MIVDKYGCAQGLPIALDEVRYRSIGNTESKNPGQCRPAPFGIECNLNWVRNCLGSGVHFSASFIANS